MKISTAALLDLPGTVDLISLSPVPWLILARVSTASRKELVDHVDTALTPHLGRAEVQAIYQLALQPHVLSKGKVGVDARAKIGWTTLFAPGTNREVGVLARRGMVWVLFINASAAQRDLGADGNTLLSLVEAIFLDPLFRGLDPHADRESRPQVLAPYADRFIRDHELAWRLFRKAREAYAVFRVAGQEPLDTLAADAETRWLMYAWEGAGSKKSTVSRLTDGGLNLYRAGLHGGQQDALLRGFRWEHEPMRDGTWRRAYEASDRTLIAHHPEPDPETWWEVETLVSIAADPSVTGWRDLGMRLGHAGITSRGKDELGVPLHELSEPATAAKLLLAPGKLDAYATGEWVYTQVGPGYGMWVLPAGHRFEPRWPGDDRGEVKYKVKVGLPDWPIGFGAEDLTALKEKWWPDGQPLPQPPGQMAGDAPRRPLASVFSWSSDGYRYEVFYHSGRYELRRQRLATARRRRDGELADMRMEDSELVASWIEAELAGHVGTFIDMAAVRLLTDHPDAELAPVTVRRVRSKTVRDDVSEQRANDLRALTEAADEAAKQHKGAAELANLLAGSGDAVAALAKHSEATGHAELELGFREQALQLAVAPLPEAGPEEGAPELLDLQTPAAVVEALHGPYATGPQPVVFNRVVKGYVSDGDNLRLDRIPDDSLNMRLHGTVRFTTVSGTTLEVGGSLVIPAKISEADADARILELTRSFMRDGMPLDKVTVLGRSGDPSIVRRQMMEFVGAGERRPNPDAASRTAVPFTALGARIPHPGLRSAAVDAPPVARRIFWADQMGEDLPAGLPAGFAAHLLARYVTGVAPDSPPEPWQGGWAREQPTRYRALAVLDSLPLLRHSGMRADHLAACLGVPVRDINDISRLWTHKHRQDPATLERLGDWADAKGSHLGPEDKFVAPIACRQLKRGGFGTCPGLVIAVLYCPEVLATGEGALCTECRRPPGSGQVFPEAYVAEALLRLQAHPGRWVPCAFAGCEVDFGAGAGLMWAYDDSAGPVWHGPDCRAGRSIEATGSTHVRRCLDPACQKDEGYGPGLLADIATRGRRRWHDNTCRSAVERQERAAAAAKKPAVRCAYANCTVDEGAGPGMLPPKNVQGTRRWHGRACKVAAGREAAGAAPAGAEVSVMCGFSACTVDDGAGPGLLRNIAGASGRPRAYHGQACARAARREREAL